MERNKPIAYLRTLAAMAAAVLTLVGAESLADPPSRFLGTWVLDLGKSTFDPPQPAFIKSQTLTVTAASGGATHTVIDTVGVDGSKYHVEFTNTNDGKAVPTVGDPDSDSIIVTPINSSTIKDVFMKGGQPAGAGTFTVSKSGKTLQGSLQGVNNGTKWKNHYVYVRQ
jgi:hypothetical protein